MTGFLLLGALLAAAVFGLLSLGYWRRSDRRRPSTRRISQEPDRWR